MSGAETAAQRARLKVAAGADQEGSELPPGSVYLYTLGCAFLGAPEADEAVTQLFYELFEAQARVEGVDCDEAIEALSMVEVPS